MQMEIIEIILIYYAGNALLLIATGGLRFSNLIRGDWTKKGITVAYIEIH